MKKNWSGPSYVSLDDRERTLAAMRGDKVCPCFNCQQYVKAFFTQERKRHAPRTSNRP